jgi:glucosylceramidase
VKFQTVKGFGGAITDAAGTNIYSLSPEAVKNLIFSYFGVTGIEYNVIRVPIGGTDFSTRAYSYADETPNDFDLQNFTLQMEDLKWKIPFVQAAIGASNKKISLFASPWSAPKWMKTNNDFKGNGTLIGPEGGKYYQTWANYYLKFFQAYQEYGLNFWALTAQNEPTDGYLYG